MGWTSLRACGYLLGETREVGRPEATRVADLLSGLPTERVANGVYGASCFSQPTSRYTAATNTYLRFDYPSGESEVLTLNACGGGVFGPPLIAMLSEPELSRVRELVGL